MHSRGGPQPQSTTVYSLDNDTVADVNQAGLVTARVIGKTVLTGKAKGIDSTSGKEIVYSKVRLQAFFKSFVVKKFSNRK